MTFTIHVGLTTEASCVRCEGVTDPKSLRPPMTRAPHAPGDGKGTMRFRASQIACVDCGCERATVVYRCVLGPAKAAA